MDDVAVYQDAVNVNVVPDVFGFCVAVRLLVETFGSMPKSQQGS